MSDYDWSQFTSRIIINAPVQNIYDSWAKQDGLEKWFLRQALFADSNKKIKARNEYNQPGDSYKWLWFGYPDTVLEEGEILTANGKDHLQFTFAKKCIVTIRIITEQGENICELVQSEIPTDELSKINYHLGCMTGWTFYFANLKYILEGGLDLRNKNVEIQHVVNA